MKYNGEIRSLTGLFLNNTLKNMNMGGDKAVESLRNNINSETKKVLENILELLSQKFYKCTIKDTDKRFLDKWDKVSRQKGGYEYLCLLRDLENLLTEIKAEKINKKYIEIVDDYYENKWPDTYVFSARGFSIGTLKKLKRWDSYTKFTTQKIEMIIDMLIIPFFEKNTAYYQNYINWIQEVNNLFSFDGKIFEYTTDEYKSVEDCIESYKAVHSFERKDFYIFLRELMEKLEAISDRKYKFDNQKTENNSKNKQKKLIIKTDNNNFDKVRHDIENIYKDIFNFPNATIGLVESEINNILFSAANNSVENYQFAYEKKHLTWEECKNNKGFMALMRYQIYRYLVSYIETNDFIKGIVKSMENYSEKQLGVFISKSAIIDNRVWIDEECRIGKCKIKSGVIVSKGVILEADHIYIHKNTFIEEKIVIQGSINVDINIMEEK